MAFPLQLLIYLISCAPRCHPPKTLLAELGEFTSCSELSLWLGQIGPVRVMTEEQKAKRANICFSVPWTRWEREHLHAAAG